MNNRFLSLLGICRKAGKLSYGYDSVVESVKAGKAAVIFICEDASEKTRKNILFEAERGHVPCVPVSYTLEDMSAAIGKKTKIISINDKGLAEKAQSALEQSTI